MTHQSSFPATRARPVAAPGLAAAVTTLALAGAASLALPAFAAAADTNGAAGSPVNQIVIATTFATIVTGVLLVLALGHRSGKVGFLGWASRFSERVSGLPGWAALPSGIAGVSLVIAVVGMYWDISLHVDVGRDPGPLANPAHYLIMIGLYGIFAAGVIAIALPTDPKDSPGATGIRLAPNWRAPLGGVLIAACGAFALIGFPLDDVWHRIFGQDVTLWGPTHLMLIGGASMTLIGIGVLTTEGLRANARLSPPREEMSWTFAMRAISLSGGLLLGLSTFQAEFDFGIAQFRFVLEPVMIMLAAGVGLVSVRIASGRGSAIGAVAFFLLIRALLSLTVGPILGETTPATPLYLVEAVVVELVALVFGTARPLRFALLSGAGIGTVGLASEWAWSHLVMPLPMPASALTDIVLYGFVAAMSGALLGAWIGTRLQVAQLPSDRSLRLGALAGAAGVALLIGFGLPKPPTPNTSATVILRDVAVSPDDPGYGGRNVQATIRLNPPSMAADARWFTMTAWQGGGLVVDHLVRVAPGVYRTTQPIPVHDSWKAMIRLQVGRSLTALPVYLPLDTAIPAKEVPALNQFTRPFIADHQVLQREQQPAAPIVSTLAYLAVGLIALSLLALLVWGLHRLGLPDAPPEETRRRGPSRTAAKAAA